MSNNRNLVTDMFAATSHSTYAVAG